MALGKVIGASVLAGVDFSNKGALLSSRLSLELVTGAVPVGWRLLQRLALLQP
jgi:formate dehydrogenase assembly factor FdhD